MPRNVAQGQTGGPAIQTPVKPQVTPQQPLAKKDPMTDEEIKALGEYLWLQKFKSEVDPAMEEIEKRLMQSVKSTGDDTIGAGINSYIDDRIKRQNLVKESDLSDKIEKSVTQRTGKLETMIKRVEAEKGKVIPLGQDKLEARIVELEKTIDELKKPGTTVDLKPLNDAIADLGKRIDAVAGSKAGADELTQLKQQLAEALKPENMQRYVENAYRKMLGDKAQDRQDDIRGHCARYLGVESDNVPDYLAKSIDESRKLADIPFFKKEERYQRVGELLEQSLEEIRQKIVHHLGFSSIEESNQQSAIATLAIMTLANEEEANLDSKVEKEVAEGRMTRKTEEPSVE